MGFKDTSDPRISAALNNIRTSKPNIKVNVAIIVFSVAVLSFYFINVNGFNLTSLVVSSLLGAVVGFFIAVFENNSLEFRMIRRRYTFCGFIAIKTVNFSIALAILLSLTILAMSFINSLFDLNFFPLGLKYFYLDQFHEILLISILIAFFINGFLEINRKLGPGVLFKLISGKYHQPRSEDRIFLFLDLNDSTNLAESMGDLKFSQLLQDFFFDLSEPVNKYKGEIYQYIGDEAVISWSLKNGIKNNNCIHCFIEIKERIDQLKDYYIENYGFVPTFKGGIHSGRVVLAEVGKIKTEIAYHGDVLNTTSRITDLCKSLKSDLLISGKLYEYVKSYPDLKYKSLGSFHLKGKSLPIDLYSIQENNVTNEVPIVDMELIS